MDKQATLQEIYNEAFNDEIDKIAAMPGSASVMKALKGAWGGIKGVGKKYAESAKGLAEGAAKSTKYMGQAFTSGAKRQFGLSRGAYAKDAGRAAIAGAKKGGLVLGTAGVAGAGGVGGAMIAGRKKD